MSWTAVTAAVGSQAERDLLAELLIAAGAAGVEERAETIISYLPGETDSGALAARLRAVVPNAEVRVESVGEILVDTSWRARVGVQRLGGITIAPPWLAESERDADGLIVIDPATAFGTGEHASTRLMLRLMQRVVRPGDRVADLGAGSAVLSIAAARLGAARVAAVELDAGSITNAEQNIVRNGVADRVKVIEGDAAVLLPLISPVRVILANIISSVIIELAAPMAAALEAGGRAVLGGVLVTERDELLRQLEASGWQSAREEVEGEWWSGVIARR